jgi:hypothetical protein
MKFCKDCKYCQRHLLERSYIFAKCAHPMARRDSQFMVSGEERYENYQYCSTQRNCLRIEEESNCGPDAQYFEPKMKSSFPISAYYLAVFMLLFGYLLWRLQQ